MICCVYLFLQWVDCVSQLLRMYPSAFEFSSAFLVDFLDCVLSCRFGNFLCNSSSFSPNFVAPIPSSWACPAEAQAGELDNQFRDMTVKFSELKKAKEVAEKKSRETATAVESLTAELRNEKQLRSTAMNLAKKASKESAAIKRAIEALGCKVHFASTGDCAVGIESNPTECQMKVSDGTVQHTEISDFSVSVTVMDDSVSRNPIGQVCEALCPLRTREGGCRWPDAGCAQLGSQFVGLKANFDAFDRLSIYDGYFQSE
ncbi:hypothetical protein Patl1_05962 [Pistacia atlantica]|uniref:Uncharacterized protein n=1 Tax=Pistacia atlantica TaxID=434234 RepID=A0ACC1BQA3_9ROSI|nr:hypothetical protein Patl1_05962 [Pistacia atlantica]